MADPQNGSHSQTSFVGRFGTFLRRRSCQGLCSGILLPDHQNLLRGNRDLRQRWEFLPHKATVVQAERQLCEIRLPASWQRLGTGSHLFLEVGIPYRIDSSVWQLSLFDTISSSGSMESISHNTFRQIRRIGNTDEHISRRSSVRDATRQKGSSEVARTSWQTALTLRLSVAGL